ncbi:DUF3347 domain-containing protein [Galbibacter sp. EGI 63066]|uniref:DUF3347 domain-containing protein n=1 Tax=Galbibacter sp. EGI 63066 TaxID=2993559 RepID=UPI0022497305|nr:DUF3347 domain-containing protein [Galbibacter sp. EGI 63066]MCX2679138.1 DUF3347 domain-containing protein [Galbibacter sp. EGI 63066]
MKYFRKKQIVLLIALGIFTIGCKDAKKENQETAIAFQSELTDKVFQHYMHIKTALTNGDVQEAKNGGDMLANTISNNYVDISTLSKKIASSSDIEVQRAAFSKLTSAIIPVLEANISEGEIYKQFCPMAFNNNGGYWLSDSKAIQNPYFGDKMLTCGEVKETINPTK